MRGQPNLAAIGSGTVVWIRQSATWIQIHLICWDSWHALQFGKCSLTCVSWDTWHALPIGKRRLTHVSWDTWHVLKWHLISNQQMQQPTEMRKKTCCQRICLICHQRVRRCLICLWLQSFQLMLLFPLFLTNKIPTRSKGTKIFDNQSKHFVWIPICCLQAKACWQVGDTCWTQVKTCWQDWICWVQAKACW